MANITSPWDQKYLREQPFMAFGSMMNAFGQINRGKNLDMVAFEVATKKIFEMAKEFTKEAYEDAAQEETLDLPVKKKL